MPDLDLLRTLAPPVEPAAPEIVRRAERRTAAPPPASRPADRPDRRRRSSSPSCSPRTASRSPRPRCKAAQASPRLLVDGWKVTRVDEWQAATGEMTFERDGRTLELQWGEERTIKDGMERVGTATVAGRRATIVRYTDAPNDFTAIWGTINAREMGVDLAEFKRTLEAIHQVGAEEWLRALPDERRHAKSAGRHDRRDAQGHPDPAGVQGARGQRRHPRPLPARRGRRGRRGVRLDRALAGRGSQGGGRIGVLAGLAAAAPDGRRRATIRRSSGSTPTLSTASQQCRAENSA